MSYDKDLYANLGSAAAEAVRIARGVPADLDGKPTPDTEWDLRVLVNHFVLWSAYALEKRGLREEMGTNLTERDFPTTDGWQDEYAATFERALDVWAAPETWEGEINDMPAPGVAGMLLLETVLHGWETAKATGQEYVCAPEVGQTLYDIVSQYAEMYRQYEGFGPEVAVAADASPFEKALGLSGRDPNWTA